MFRQPTAIAGTVTVMPEPDFRPADPVTAADVELAVGLALAAMREAAAGDWSVPAGSLEWDCWETAEHMSDGLFAYAAQLGPKDPPLRDPVPVLCEPRRPGGPAIAIAGDRSFGPAGLLQIFEATGAVLVAMVAAAPDYQSPPRPFGVADPGCFAAAAGVAEVLVHTHDVATGLGFGWTPPAPLCSRVLGRMFPDAPADSDPWAALLWSTGRDELPGRPAVTSWTWHAGPRD
jgi:hypothetical protein